jgi:hypothetical protein
MYLLDNLNFQILFLCPSSLVTPGSTVNDIMVVKPIEQTALSLLTIIALLTLQ